MEAIFPSAINWRGNVRKKRRAEYFLMTCCATVGPFHLFSPLLECWSGTSSAAMGPAPLHPTISLSPSCTSSLTRSLPSESSGSSGEFAGAVVNADSSIPSVRALTYRWTPHVYRHAEPIALVIIDNSCPAESVNEAVDVVIPFND